MAIKALLVLAALTIGSAHPLASAQCAGDEWIGSEIGNQRYSSHCVSTRKTVVPRAVALKRIISFGDSYSQTGFNPDSTLPSSSNPLGNPALPGWTTSGGRNWLGYYTTTYNSTLTYNYNFASGGATTDSTLIPPYANSVLSLVQQVSRFKQYLGSRPAAAPWTSSDTLFAIWIGVNDVGNGYSRSNWETLLEQTMEQYFNQTQVLYDAGARKFLLLTVPPIHLTPLVIAQGTSTQGSIRTAVTQYNSALNAGVQSFVSKNPDIKYWVLDTTGDFNAAINDPTRFGAKDATCDNTDGVTCLWWNNYHPGLAIHELVAKNVAEILGDW